MRVSLDGYEDYAADLVVKENETANPGLITLSRSMGNVEVASDPAGIDFELTPEGSFGVSLEANPLSGKTPATLTAVPAGRYMLVARRPGWPDYREAVNIERNNTAHVTARFASGKIRIISIPDKAKVLVNGVALGQTPLLLDDQKPGDVHYQIVLAGYDPIEIFGTAESGKIETLTTTLERSDRLARPSEVDQIPEAVTQVGPDMKRGSFTSGVIIIGLTVDRDGLPRDLRIEKATDRVLGQLCMEAAAQWRFKPAMKKGVPVNVRVSLPFTIRPIDAPATPLGP